jgi:hypothetical protein
MGEELFHAGFASRSGRSDFNDIKRYKEFEVSPPNEWVDPDINLSAPRHEDGWLWNSGFEHSARIDRSAHIW